MMKVRWWLAAAVLCVWVWPVWADEVQGRVVGVTDGDTLTVLSAWNRQVKVRLSDIDTPESRQPYGKKAKQALSTLVFGKAVRVQVRDTDRYGRSVGRVFVGDVDVNARMVEQGAAWVYRQYSNDAALLQMEGQAKTAQRGLWVLPEAQRQPPWEWRRGAKPGPVDQDTAKAKPAAEESGSACGGKSTCKQMASCAEARHYLNDCGVRRLDRDGDGVPCESLCGG